jgi:ELWxxDGT repeat protein
MIRMFLTATFLTEIDATRLAKLNEKLVFFVTKRYENPQNIWVMWNSWELWTSDGTPEGTSMVKPVYTGWNQPMISPATFSHGYLFFQANGVEDKADAQSWKNGGGMWRTDNTTTGTVRIETLNEEMLDVNGTLFFTLHRAGSCALYRSDGSDPSTTLIWQINEDCAFPLTGRGAELFFASASEKGDLVDCTLWASNGTQSSTKPILRFQVKPGSTCIRDMVMLGDRLAILLTERGTSNSSLWTSDGTAPGTVLVRTIPGGFIENLNFRILHVVGDHLFFSSTRIGKEDTCALWVSDGTPDGTRFLKSVCLDDFSMMPVGKQLFFTVDVPGSGWELWKSDGTPAGTQLVQTGFTYGRDASRPRLLVGDRGILYFNVHDNEGCALWRSDGTATGTAPLHRGCPQELVSVNGTLFFILSRQEPSIELWKSDGTAAGTIPVKVIP